MAKDDRSAINPFTNKKHFDIINDDKFLQQSYNEYYKVINQSQLLDNTPQGKLVKNIAVDLINGVEAFLEKIGRSDYTENYYDWEFHLIGNPTVNAFCMPGGKIVMYSGILGPANSENDIALILGHEMAHALLDHSRTRASVRSAKNGITTAARIGAIGLSLFGMGELGNIAGATANVADVGSEFLLLKPFDRGHEFEADKLGMMIMHWAGYDISDAPNFWSRVTEGNENKMDFFSTHPADSKRIANMRELIREINNGKDFYNSPVLDSTSSNSLPVSTFKCPSCGRSIDEDSEFCTYCGEKIANDLSSNNSTNILNKEESSNFIFCSFCGSKIDKNSKFCSECGTSLDSSKTCKNCGKVLDPSDIFCTNCGEKI